MECVLTVTFEILESALSTVGKVDSLVLQSGETASPTAAEQGQTSNNATPVATSKRGGSVLNLDRFKSMDYQRYR